MHFKDLNSPKVKSLPNSKLRNQKLLIKFLNSLKVYLGN